MQSCYSIFVFWQMNENQLAFYTCFYGSESNVAFRIPPLPSTRYKCYYYTNNKNLLAQIKQTQWIGIYDDKPTHDDLIESCMAGKHVKVMPQEFPELQGYDYLVFLDSKLEKVNERFVEYFIYEYFIKRNYALLLRNHTFLGPNIWNEYNQSILQVRYDMQKQQYLNYIHKQLQNGMSETTLHHCMCGFLIRNMKHEKMVKLNTTWYQHIQECGIQDQISFFFVKQLFDDVILPFRDIPFI